MNDSSQFAVTFLQESAEQLALVEDLVLAIEKNASDAEAIDRLFRVFHTIKGSGAMFGYDEVVNVAHHIESGLGKVRSGSMVFSRAFVDVILAGKDMIEALLQGKESEIPVDSGPKIIARIYALMPIKTAKPAAGAGTSQRHPPLPPRIPRPGS